MHEERGSESTEAVDNAIVVGVVSASVAVVVIISLACCCICRLFKRRHLGDEEDRPLL